MDRACSMSVYRSTEFLTAADRKVVAAARRRGGEKAANQLIARIASRATETSRRKNVQREKELESGVDQNFRTLPMLQPVRRRAK
jgi:uncharacterized protein HemY